MQPTPLLLSAEEGGRDRMCPRELALRVSAAGSATPSARAAPRTCRMSDAMLRVRLGISEIDSYNMLFYSHYLRYNERAANSCLSPESSSAVLRRVAVAKYMSSVRWNDAVDIRTTAVAGPSAEGEHTLLHEWFVAEQYEKPAYLSLCTYTVCGVAGFTGARTPDVKEARRIQALQREAGLLFTPQGGGGCSETLPVYPDMIGPGGSLAVPCMMEPSPLTTHLSP